MVAYHGTLESIACSTTTGASSSSTVWPIPWTTTSTTSSDNYAPIRFTWSIVSSESDEARQARLEREREAREEADRRRAEANRKADELLKSLLDPEQIRQLDELAYFILTAPSGRVYRIKRGFAGNVEELDDRARPVVRYCLHPEIRVPDGDAMLAQMLMIETDEEEFLRVANRIRLAV